MLNARTLLLMMHNSLILHSENFLLNFLMKQSSTQISLGVGGDSLFEQQLTVIYHRTHALLWYSHTTSLLTLCFLQLFAASFSVRKR